MSVPLFCTTRNGVVERLERGHCVLSAADGAVLWSVGDIDHVTYTRSSAKPLQATALVMSGAMERFGLTNQALAVACASHLGEARHVRTVREMLRRAGVPPEALACGTHDLGTPEALRLARAHLGPTPLHNNCSGKHAGMLVAAQALGAPLEGYLEPDHPVQALVRQTLVSCSGVPEQELHLGLDGCSAPNAAMSMRHIARCFASIAAPTGLPPSLAAALTRIGAAMRADPWLVRGTGGFDTVLMQSLGQRVTSKGGAEGLQCLALNELGLGLAIKVESGRADGIGSVVISILRELGQIGDMPPALKAIDCPAIRNHRGTVVGESRVLLDITALRRVTRASLTA